MQGVGFPLLFGPNNGLVEYKYRCTDMQTKGRFLDQFPQHTSFGAIELSIIIITEDKTRQHHVRGKGREKVCTDTCTITIEPHDHMIPI